jgi:DNA-binding MarR family transcriptional regulator
MKYHKKKLGRLQKRILKYIITHDDYEFTKISHLWSSFQLIEPTVSKSVQSLVKYGYLKRGYGWSLDLTDKGAAAAIMGGSSY